MSRDGKGERITRPVAGQPTFEDKMPCGGVTLGLNQARYRRCSLGHTHCMSCLREARRFGKGWTCGICPGVPFGPMIAGVDACRRCGWSAQFCQCGKRGEEMVCIGEPAERIMEIIRGRRGEDNV